MAELKFPNPVAHALAVCGTGHAPHEYAEALAKHLAGPDGEKFGAILRIEPEKGVIKLEASETVSQFLSLRRLTDKRVILINEAHTLNAQATNALLKLVEEPPEGTHFIFITPEPGLLLPTMRSRVQVIRIPNDKRETLEKGETHNAAATYLGGCIRRDSTSVRQLLDGLEGREAAIHAARAMQELLRDWAVIEFSEPLHVDHVQEIRQWPEVQPEAKVELWRRARQMEHDLHGNVDRGLVFENFYMQVPNAMD